MNRKLKDPLAALLVAPDEEMRQDILFGRKQITIREGHRDYRIGQAVMLCCHLRPWAVMSKIISVRHCRLREVTREECNADGFSDSVELLNGLQRFYQNITVDSPVTVIRWGDVSGFLVDNK